MARFPALNTSAPVALNQVDLSYNSMEEVVLMEAEGGSGDPRKTDNVHGNNGGNLNKQSPDFEEIIRDIDEAIQYDLGVSNSKRDIHNKLLTRIGNSSNQGVDGVSGNITKHTGSDFKEFKENTPLLGCVWFS